MLEMKKLSLLTKDVLEMKKLKLLTRFNLTKSKPLSGPDRCL